MNVLETLQAGHRMHIHRLYPWVLQRPAAMEPGVSPLGSSA